MTCPASFTQRAFRGRNDDGNETTATWKANQDVNWTQAVDTNFRIRFQLQEGAACAGANKVWRMQYNKNSAGWVDCSASSLVVRASASPNLADGANLTTQLTGGTGTFIGLTGFDEVDCNAGGASMDVAASGNSECEFSVQIRSADTVNGDSVQLRVTDAGTAIASYTSTPTITVSAPVSITLTGKSATASAGSFSASASIALTGTSGTASAGTLVPSTSYSVSLVGNEATASAGTLAASASLALAGVEATAAPGSLAASVSIAITGNEASGAIGTLTPESGGTPVSVALTGVSASVLIGLLTPSADQLPVPGSSGGNYRYLPAQSYGETRREIRKLEAEHKRVERRIKKLEAKVDDKHDQLRYEASMAVLKELIKQLNRMQDQLNMLYTKLAEIEDEEMMILSIAINEADWMQ